MEFLEIQEVLQYEDIEDYHEVLVVEKQTPVKQLRMRILDVINGILSVVGVLFNEHETTYGNGAHIPSTGLQHSSLGGIAYGNGAHIPAVGLSHTALTNKGINTHSDIDNAISNLSLHINNDSIHVSYPVWSNLTLVNGWTALAGYGTPQICIDKFGFVHLRGVVSGAGATATTICTLPTGLRPASTLLFPSVFPVNNYYVTITSAGVLAVNTICSWISFDSIAPFDAA